MKTPIWLFLTLTAHTLAQICNDTDGFYVSRQTELDLIAQHCTQISGFLTIWPNYTGPAILPNVTNIGSVRFDTPFYDTNVTSLSFPDLLSTQAITLYSTPTLRNLSVPKLEFVSSFYASFPADVDEVRFPALQRTEDFVLQGNISRVVFDQLETVDGRVQICNAFNCAEDLLPARKSMAVEFGKLERAQQIRIIGDLGRLSAPELTVIASPGLSNYPGLELGLYGQPMELSLPKLSRIEDSAEIKGNITSLSLPALRDYPPEFKVDSAVSLNLSLPVETAGDISLHGEIESVDFPNLRNFTEIEVSSSLALDCESLGDALNDTATDVTVDDDNFECESTTNDARGLYSKDSVVIYGPLALVLVIAI